MRVRLLGSTLRETLYGLGLMKSYVIQTGDIPSRKSKIRAITRVAISVLLIIIGFILANNEHEINFAWFIFGLLLGYWIK